MEGKQRLENSPMGNMYNFTNSARTLDCLIYILSCGYFITDEKFFVERNSFNSYLAVYIQEGEFYYINDSNEIVYAKSGSLIFLDCYKHHIYGTISKSKFYWIHFAGNGLNYIFDCMTADGKLIFKNQEADHFGEFIISVYDACRHKLFLSETGISAKIYSFICDLIEDDVKNNYISYNNISVSSVLEYISANYKNDITIDDMASHAQVSKSYMTRLFRETVGQSPYAVLKNYRIERALELLEKTALPVKDIVYKTGFKSESNFILAFKNYAGMSPGRYRNSKQKK